MSNKTALTGASIFDGEKIVTASAVLVEGALCAGVVPRDSVPSGYDIVELDGGLLTAGYVDLQVNGGGGALFNETPTVSAIRTICNAHASFGTVALLPTLITDTPDVTAHAIEAGVEAKVAGVRGFLGLHLEGPHLSVPKKGAHSADLIRPMTDKDVRQLCAARKQLDNLLLTVAPESVDDDQISELANAGILISLGHTAARANQARRSFAAGATAVTHLYNAMSPLTHREPGLVGAALTQDRIFCGLIADGFHVDPDAINIAMRMKTGEGKLFLVTDAMSTIGTSLTELHLNGRKILRQGGRLTLADGTLAGADLDMNSAVQFMVQQTQCSMEEALRMASQYPAACLGIQDQLGTIENGKYANLVHLDKASDVSSVWIKGEPVVAPTK